MDYEVKNGDMCPGCGLYFGVRQPTPSVCEQCDREGKNPDGLPVAPDSDFMYPF